MTPSGTPTPAPIATPFDSLLVAGDPVLVAVLVLLVTTEDVVLDSFTKSDRAATPEITLLSATEKLGWGEPLMLLQNISLEV